MHITVCICTYRRPDLLARLLRELAVQETGGRFTYSVVVVDNDWQESARDVVVAATETFPGLLQYRVEPRQSIALARNRAVASAAGDFIAFIDDDELPIKTWLLTLFATCMERGVDGVLGPVKPHFDTEPPAWLVRGRFHERPDYPTGFLIDGRRGRTGNVLLRRTLFPEGQVAFNPVFVTGEDQEFFWRKIAEGGVFVWCHEAIALEVIPPARWTRSFVVRRAMMRGRYSVLEPSFGVLDLGKSLAAVVIYGAALPLQAIMGQHRLMKNVERLCYHLGKLLACVKLNPVGDRYVSD
jgi:glycosyltransferase involved in cell wall biosynthesis